MVIISLTLLGLAFGSFINALVWRLHKQSITKNKKQKAQLSIVNGRSRCVHCRHKLGMYDLIPVLSWLYLRGRCRYCHEPISLQYPLVELSTVILFIISYLYWPGFQDSILEMAEVVDFGVWLAALTGLIALVVYDLRWMLLPNKIIFPLLGLAGLNVLLQSILTSSADPLTSSLWGALIGAGIFYLLFQLSDGQWIGGGDVKLGFLLGILVGGPLPAFLMLFIASLLGTAYSLPRIIGGGLTVKARLPFGPFLIAGGIITKLFGQGIVDWYLNSFFY
ncbi:prepilin peptidase [Candidatus Parcubacteria bacterium]|nr:prepilin peptidase [Candidatus Parcubacteria bacterium]